LIYMDLLPFKGESNRGFYEIFSYRGFISADPGIAGMQHPAGYG
jgi:hypothetical protein